MASIAVVRVFLLTVLVALSRPTCRFTGTAGAAVLVAAPFIGYVLVTSLPGFPLG